MPSMMNFVLPFTKISAKTRKRYQNINNLYLGLERPLIDLKTPKLHWFEHYQISMLSSRVTATWPVCEISHTPDATGLSISCWASGPATCTGLTDHWISAAPLWSSAVFDWMTATVYRSQRSFWVWPQANWGMFFYHPCQADMGFPRKSYKSQFKTRGYPRSQVDIGQ